MNMKLENSIILLEKSRESLMSRMYQIESGIFRLKVKHRGLRQYKKQISSKNVETHTWILINCEKP